MTAHLAPLYSSASVVKVLVIIGETVAIVVGWVAILIGIRWVLWWALGRRGV